MKLVIYNQQGEQTQETVDLNPRIFEVQKIKPGSIHQIVVAQLANKRNVVASTKTRGEVRGGGKKPWQQKGTGRARAGSIRSPLWKGGGVTFGPRSQRNFTKKVNRKLKRLGMFAVLSDKAKEKKLVVLENLEITAPKTKVLANKLSDLGSRFENWGKKVLLILPAKNENLIRAAKNLPNLKINYAFNLNILDLLTADRVVVLKDALPLIEKTYLRSTNPPQAD